MPTRPTHTKRPNRPLGRRVALIAGLAALVVAGCGDIALPSIEVPSIALPSIEVPTLPARPTPEVTPEPTPVPTA